jgi:uncharacterized protein YbjT (DUF2867 family)
MFASASASALPLHPAGRVVLVTNAGGHRGRAAVRHLLAAGWRVRALLRDPRRPVARALRAAGAEVVPGDPDDRAALDRALAGVYAVCGGEAYDPRDPAAGERRGRALAEAVRWASVSHLVYCSVAGADRRSGVPEQESQRAVEAHLQLLGLPATVLRPTFPMEYFASPQRRRAVLAGALRFGLPAAARLQLVAPEDVGAFCALALARPADFVGRTLDLAGDEPTMAQVAAALGRAAGRPVRYVPLPLPRLRRRSPNLAALIAWLRQDGYRADPGALRALYPRLSGLEAWLRDCGWAAPAGAPDDRPDPVTPASH